MRRQRKAVPYVVDIQHQQVPPPLLARHPRQCRRAARSSVATAGWGSGAQRLRFQRRLRLFVLPPQVRWGVGWHAPPACTQPVSGKLPAVERRLSSIVGVTIATARHPGRAQLNGVLLRVGPGLPARPHGA